MFIEISYDKNTGEITSVYENERLPVADPANGWKPFTAPVDPDTHQAILTPDGGIDFPRLPANYGAAKVDLDYATGLRIEEGAYAERVAKSQWIMANLKVDLASETLPPGDKPGALGTVRLVHLAI